jgi:2-phosphoglycerate kinase
MVLEGVHLVPGMLPHRIDGALLVPCVLEIPDEEIHSGHFHIRDASSEARTLAKYLDHFSEIRRIQRYIVERARKTGVPVIANTDVEATLSEILELVVAAAEGLRAPVQ